MISRPKKIGIGWWCRPKQTQSTLRTCSRNTQNRQGISAFGLIDGAKAQAEEAREKLRGFRSPSDQLRHKLDRERKLGLKAEKLKENIKQHLLVVAEAEDELDSLREQLHEAQEEMQRIANQKIILASPAGAPVAPKDIAQCVTAM